MEHSNSFGDLVGFDKDLEKYKIAIFGFGIVGRGVYDIIKENDSFDLENIDVLYVFDKKDNIKKFQKEIKDVKFTDNIEEIMTDENVDIIVECLGGVDFSFNVFKLAMSNGKDFVTSNKALLAEKYYDIAHLLEKSYSNIAYEAAVGGGVPIFHTIHNMKKVERISNFMGIINGTTNYILTKMAESNDNMDTVIKEAQKLGLAEKDPSSDIDGVDAKYKLLLLENFIFDTSFKIDEIINFGIRNILPKDLQFAKDNDATIKLVACGDQGNAFVMPMFINNNDALSTVPSNYNAIEIYCDNLKNIILVGQGASRYPTAHSVVLDIVDIVNDDLLFFPTYDNEDNIIENHIESNFYIRGKNLEELNDLKEKSIDEDTIITKTISIKDLNEKLKNVKNDLFVCKM